MAIIATKKSKTITKKKKMPEEMLEDYEEEMVFERVVKWFDRSVQRKMLHRSHVLNAQKFFI